MSGRDLDYLNREYDRNRSVIDYEVIIDGGLLELFTRDFKRTAIPIWDAWFQG